MGFAITFSKLFEVQILHHYFLDTGTVRYDALSPDDKAAADKNYQVPSFLQILPTEACMSLMKNNGCVFRPTATGFVVFIRSAKKAGKLIPVSIPEADSFFGFTLRFTDPYFKNYTSLALQNDAGTTCFFSNINKANAQVFPSLTHPAPLKAAGKKYNAGDIITDGGQTQIAGKITADTLVQDFTTEAPLNGKAPQYVTVADRVAVTNGSITVSSVKPEAELQPLLKVSNSAGKEVMPRLSFTTLTDGTAKTIAQLNFSQLPEDVYTVATDTGTKDWLYTREKKIPDGILQIVVAANSAAYHLLADADVPDNHGNIEKIKNVLLQPVFELRFKNRSTAWRYNGKLLNAPADTGYKPMTAKGKIAVTITDKNGKNMTGMPNADVTLVKPEPVIKDNKVFVDDELNMYYNTYSEIYI